MTGLTPKKTYEFRVCAVNAAGPGEFSANSAPICAQNAACRPRMSMLTRDIIAYAGEPAKVTHHTISETFVDTYPVCRESSTDGNLEKECVLS